MTSIKRFCVSIMFFLSMTLFCTAQQSINASGAHVLETSGSISYSVGQVDYISATNSSANINQGVQQAFEIFEATGIPIEPVKFQFSLFPNPARSFVTLSLDSIGQANFSYRIIDLMGREIVNTQIFNSSTQIPLNGFADGTYMVCVFDNNDLLHTFLLVKH